jgi:hypothetical protein
MLLKLVACANLLLVTPLSVSPDTSRAFRTVARESTFRQTPIVLEPSLNRSSSNLRHDNQGNNAVRMAVSAMLVATMIFSPIPAFADEYGVEKEAPTLFTGETVEVRIANAFFWRGGFCAASPRCVCSSAAVPVLSCCAYVYVLM